MTKKLLQTSIVMSDDYFVRTKNVSITIANVVTICDAWRVVAKIVAIRDNYIVHLKNMSLLATTILFIPKKK